MKYSLALLFLCFFLNSVSAQEKHFVFIESDTRQPFYVSLNGKIYSSSASGYVIIPKLAEGEYNATIGFAANTFSEQSFKYLIGKKDLGFSLKNFGEKGWGLSDLQTMAVTMAGEVKPASLTSNSVEKPKEEYKPEISFERKKDTLITNATPKKEEQLVIVDTNISPLKVVDTVPLIVATTTNPSVNATQPPADTLKSAPQLPVEQKTNVTTSKVGLAINSTVKKLAEVKGNMGMYITYVDGNDQIQDTIQLIIPTSNVESTSANQISSVNTFLVKEEIPEKNSKKDSDLQFLNMEINSVKKDSTTQGSLTTAMPSAIINSNCVDAATESDYNKLRRKISAQTTEDDKINEAKKVFKNKCFTTSQVKGLSSLFISDESRYKFFDVSYNFVTDVQLYSSLETELIDPYYIARFKAMLRH